MTKILLVEDDKSLREIYGVRLLAEGYDIISAGDGEEALAMAIKDRPDLIVSDVMMPKISGFDMLDILRSTTETKGIRVIMMTALSSEDQRKRGEALGADRYLVKSQVGIEDVVRTVHEVLGDAPVTSAAAFTSTPAPTPAPTSAATPAILTAPATPAPTPVASNPVSIPVSSPMPTPMTPTPIAPAPAPAPTPASTPVPQPTIGSTLPQPTAPFSTTRPANLGDRVIHPLENSAPKPDFASMMAGELGQQPSASPAPASPVTAPAPTPMPAPAAPQQITVTSQPVQATPPAVPVTPPAPSGLNFEETPRIETPPAPTPPQSGV